MHWNLLAGILHRKTSDHHAQSAVTKRIPQPRAELSPSIRAHEAQLLTVMLRTSRLTCVFGESGTDKTSLLTSGVMPLLRRRQAERSASQPVPMAPFAGSDRRRPALSAGGPTLEAALYFDQWDDNSLATLKARLGDLVPAAAAGQDMAPRRLAELLRVLGDRAGCRFILLLDRFEEFLSRSPNQGDSAAFADELVESLLAPRLAASFLISLDESARPRLERFRSRVPGFDHNSLRLAPIATPSEQELPLHSPVAPAQAASESRPESCASQPQATAGNVEVRFVPSKRKPQRRDPPPRVPIRVDEVYAFIEATLARTAAQRADEPAIPDVAAGASDAAPRAVLPSSSGQAAGARVLPAVQPVQLTEEVVDRVGAERRLVTALDWLRKRRSDGK